MDDYVQTSDDNGGVHINSGIPNHAFYLAASAIGGNAWAGAGRIWYAALTGPGISADCDFATFAGLTLAAALAEFGDASPEVTAVESAWREVGVLRARRSPAAGGGRGAKAGAGAGSTAASPSGATELLVRRTGGFAGLRRERSVRLDELPVDDAHHWRCLLVDERLAALIDGPSHPDAFCYEVQCSAPAVQVSLPEPGLPDEVRALFERTLLGAD